MIARVVLRQRASGQKIVEVMMMMVACGYRIEFALSQLTIAHVPPACLALKIIPQAKRVPRAATS